MLVVYYRQVHLILKLVNWKIKSKLLNQNQILVVWLLRGLKNVENKIPDVTGFVKLIDYNSEIAK